jgi:hypothetical protein
MAATSSSAHDDSVRANVPPEELGSTWAIGSFIFATAVMIMGGVFQTALGLGALFSEGFFSIDRDYAYGLDPTIWGWLHLGAGVLLILAGFYVFTGALWARLVGIGAALISAAIVFPSVPIYPVWAILIISIDVVMIWALTAYAGDFADGM